MKKVEIITRPEKLETVKHVANELGMYGMTVTTVYGCGQQKGRTEFYRGAEYNVNLLAKIKVEIVVPDEAVNSLVEAIAKSVRTGAIGDGKIFVSAIEEAVKIRTGELGEKAINS